MKNIYLYLLASALVFCLSGCDMKFGKQQEKKEVVSSPKTATIETIKDRGVLLVGVKGDTYKFGYKDPHTNIIDGFDVDIAKALAKKILGSEKKLKLTAVTTSSRGPVLDSGAIDYVIATFTTTEERKKLYSFSNPYYIDGGVGMVVKKASNIRRLSDLNGKKIGVAKNSTAIKAMQDATSKEGITIQFVEFDTYPSIKAALDANKVDCFATNGIILMQFATEDDVILEEKFTPQAYGIVAKKGGDELVKIANELIDELNFAGTMQHIVAKWGL